jgi:hypothetical protein
LRKKLVLQLIEKTLPLLLSEKNVMLFLGGGGMCHVVSNLQPLNKYKENVAAINEFSSLIADCSIPVPVISLRTKHMGYKLPLNLISVLLHFLATVPG